MRKRTAVAIYARISQDRDGDGLGVRRQIADCEDEVARRGWTTAEVYVDDDLSAYSGRPRPAYDRLVEDIQHGRRDAVVVWHLDRLHRRPVELEQFVSVCTTAGLTDVVTLTGNLDLGNGDGLLIARLLSAVAANESDSKRRRGRRKMQELAEAGKPHGGGTRPFGFLDDKTSHHPIEAPVIRELARRALLGETVTALARWLDENEIRTVTGRPWRPQVVRQLLLNPRIAGQRTHRGSTLSRATWEPIISLEEASRLRALLTDPARRTNRSARRYLLSGLCRCGKCGSKLYSVPRFETRRYLCRGSTGFDGCGGIAVAAEPLETFVVAAVLYRLDSPEVHRELSGTGTDSNSAVLLEQLESDSAQLAELATMWGDKSITTNEWKSARDRIESRQSDARRSLARLTKRDVLSEVPSETDALYSYWGALALDQQVAIVRAVIDHVVIEPATRPGLRGLDPDRVRAIWRA